ncbi:hypothetical protein ACU4GD_11670 [Cupriavidus basilensis]
MAIWVALAFMIWASKKFQIFECGLHRVDRLIAGPVKQVSGVGQRHWRKQYQLVVELF